MLAVIESGGKQYKVQKGDVIDVEKLESEAGKKVEFNNVLLVCDKDKVEVGKPFIENAKVVGALVKQDRAKKVIAFKFKRRKNYKKKIGHRQDISVVKIEDIKL
ncbi:50S ribosomal protein L21 [Candidatus Auribacterota bacterium]